MARRGLVDTPAGYVFASGAPDTVSDELAGASGAEVLERIMGNNDLMGIAFLEQGMRLSRTVCRVWVDATAAGGAAAFGTGFLVSPSLMLTNHHVLGDPEVAARSLAQFDYALHEDGSPYPAALFEVDVDRFHLADKALDFALVALKPNSREGRPLPEYGWNQLIADEGKAIEAQYSNIIQHPAAGYKQLALRENRIVDIFSDYLHYTADTLGGSSGSPVFNDRWEVIALHHSGVWATNAAGKPLCVDGVTVWRPEMGEDQLKWLYNEGVRVSSLVRFIQAQPVGASRKELVEEMLNMVARPTASAPAATGGRQAEQTAYANADGVATWTIPLRISMSIGDTAPARVRPPAAVAPPLPEVAAKAPTRPEKPPNAGEHVGDAELLREAQQAFGRYGALKVRLGYEFRDGVITKNRALVVTVAEKASMTTLRTLGYDRLPDTFRGMPVQVTPQTPEDIMAEQLGPAGHERLASFAMPRAEEITYKPPAGVNLGRVTDRMKVTAHVSPDVGWPTLAPFLSATRRRLVVGMYDFGAPHIVKATEAMGKKTGFQKFTLSMREHGSLGDPEGDGVKANDYDNADAAKELANQLKAKFECAFVAQGLVNGWIAKAYHIKVAVRDSSAFWISSGNWQSSNQPDVAPLNDNPQTIEPLHTYNREWHAIVEHDELAKTFEAYLLNDFNNNPAAEEAAQIPLPDLFVPIELPGLDLEATPAFRYFEPFIDDRQFSVTPLLTPDRFVEPVVELINRAQNEILLQNQTFAAPLDGQDELAQLIDAIIGQQNRGVKVRIIIRKFMAAKDRQNLEMLADRGLDPASVRYQINSHTKGLIIDRKEVLLGSQNWTQLGVTLNRDASLLFEDPALAQYFAQIFDHDWNVLASPKIGSGKTATRVARANEATPPGFVRISAADVLNPP
ncbi:phospholipase D-like domain-containing protein [Rhodoblastus sp.]|uniref:phospholipase D-like domain-containing protein n=1 Tax=Rhodoblastus sp. TaxID=1962975 RepID=UPI0025CDB631|nr:phospholipase D-like domain-containing protein [Rhodoblastus sp.]